MLRSTWRIRAAVVLACLAPLPALAQIIADPSLRDPRRAPRPQQQQSPSFSPLAVAPWPRLDPGAVLCRTRDDLEMHSRAVAARANGEQVPLVGSPDCKVVVAITAIEVVSRLSPAETEIRVKGDPKTSWTDTWLPAQQPSR